jgi:hypothetical protein
MTNEELVEEWRLVQARIDIVKNPQSKMKLEIGTSIFGGPSFETDVKAVVLRNLEAQYETLTSMIVMRGIR